MDMTSLSLFQTTSYLLIVRQIVGKPSFLFFTKRRNGEHSKKKEKKKSNRNSKVNKRISGAYLSIVTVGFT